MGSLHGVQESWSDILEKHSGQWPRSPGDPIVTVIWLGYRVVGSCCRPCWGHRCPGHSKMLALRVHRTKKTQGPALSTRGLRSPPGAPPYFCDIMDWFRASLMSRGSYPPVPVCV